ncbi:MAG: hypothetical protein JOY77_13165 [Alphaproteobacteria bacterium]|nr:hypothetical protein [Alphaproteobacteria bacterium]
MAGAGLGKAMDAEQAARRATITARLTLLMFFLMGVFFVISGYKLASVRGQLKSINGEIDEQQKKLAQLKSDYHTALAAANEPVKTVPVLSEIKPKANAEPVGKQPNGNPIYNFTCYLTAPPETLKEVQKVSYFFNHSSFAQKTLESEDAANGFAVSYKGWGALDLVVIDVRLKNGESRKLYFDMLKDLGWE